MATAPSVLKPTVPTAIPSWLKTHVFYIVLIAVGLVFGHSWLVEHDNRLATQQELKVSQAKIQDLTTQIAAIQAQAQKQVVAVQAVVASVKTPAQAIAAIPSMTDIPLNARISPLDTTSISVEALPFTQLLGQCKIDAVQLAACTATNTAKDAIISEQKADIVQLKKPQGFWKRTATVLKSVGIGIGIGALLGSHAL